MVSFIAIFIVVNSTANSGEIRDADSKVLAVAVLLALGFGAFNRSARNGATLQLFVSTIRHCTEQFRPGRRCTFDKSGRPSRTVAAGCRGFPKNGPETAARARTLECTQRLHQPDHHRFPWGRTCRISKHPSFPVRKSHGECTLV